MLAIWPKPQAPHNTYGAVSYNLVCLCTGRSLSLNLFLQPKSVSVGERSRTATKEKASERSQLREEIKDKTPCNFLSFFANDFSFLTAKFLHRPADAPFHVSRAVYSKICSPANGVSRSMVNLTFIHNFYSVLLKISRTSTQRVVL